MTWRILTGDCREQLAELPAASIDAVVTDPPYGLEFMGQDWDAPWKHGFTATGYSDGSPRPPRPNFGSTRNPMCRTCRKHQRGTDSCACATPNFDERPADSNRAFQAWVETWAIELLRVLKPGGHALVFGGTRTYHRLASGLEDAGFEIRDCIAWMYGSGFPKSLDVSKAVDARLGVEGGYGEIKSARAGINVEGRAAASSRKEGWDRPWKDDPEAVDRNARVYEPGSDEARRWAGWGTALKPAWESVIVAVKPEDGGTVYANLCQLSNRLLTLLSAKDAAVNFECPSTAYDEAFASARWDADELCSTRDALSAATATSQFGSVIASSLSIVSSWLDILADVLGDPSTSITSTGSSTTTVLRILNSCLSELTPLSIIQAVMNPPGSTSVVARADEAFAAAALSMEGTRALFALERAIGKAPISRLEEDAPACSPIVVARKPLAGTVAATVLAHGTGALNIDGCRVAMSEGDADAINAKHAGMDADAYERAPGASLRLSTDPIGFNPAEAHALGRWPANVVLWHSDGCVRVGEASVAAAGHGGQDGIQERYAAGERVAVWDCEDGCPVRALDEQTGDVGGGFGRRGALNGGATQWGFVGDGRDVGYGDSGGASRFFYTAKASTAERHAGLVLCSCETPLALLWCPDCGGLVGGHPTVKPVAIMRWLVRLVTPPGGLVADPFTGSGTTGIACALEGFDFVGVEQSPEYAAIAAARIAYWDEHGEDALRVAETRQTSERDRQERADAGQLDLFAGES